MADSNNLQRFIDTQLLVCEDVMDELRRGRKTGHWMWFIFPQLQGLGSSSTSNFFGIRDIDEARAFLNHPELGERLRTCTEMVYNIDDRSAKEIFGYPDYLKFRSCMTLFNLVAEEGNPFQQVLDKFYNGQPDELTLAIIGGNK